MKNHSRSSFYHNEATYHTRKNRKWRWEKNSTATASGLQHLLLSYRLWLLSFFLKYRHCDLTTPFPLSI